MVMADQELARRVAFGFLNELLKRVRVARLYESLAVYAKLTLHLCTYVSLRMYRGLNPPLLRTVQCKLQQ